MAKTCEQQHLYANKAKTEMRHFCSKRHKNEMHACKRDWFLKSPWNGLHPELRIFLVEVPDVLNEIPEKPGARLKNERLATIVVITLRAKGTVISEPRFSIPCVAWKKSHMSQGVEIGGHQLVCLWPSEKFAVPLMRKKVQQNKK